jgi:N-acetylneuraminate synthase
MEIVAEFTYNHFGNIDRAKEMIDAAKKSGATCVKFELRNSEKYFRNNYEIQKKRAAYEFTDEQINEFVLHCKKAEIDWFASVHDIHSLQRILPFLPKYIKIASREARAMDFLLKVKELNNKTHPIIISTGGLSFEQVKEIYQLFKDEQLFLLHTNCIYPCTTEKLNMNRIRIMRASFDCKIGYSGHEVGFLPSLYAVSLGINYLERHFTLNDKSEVAKGLPEFKDDECTLSPEQFREMVNAVNLFIQLSNQPVDQGISAEEIKRVNAYGKIDWDGEDVFLQAVDLHN